MAHEVLWSHSYNGYIRQLRSFLMDHPRVVRANDHDDINNVGVDYKVSGGGSDRPAGDILHIAAEASCPHTVQRATCVVGVGTAGAYQTSLARTVTFNTGAKTIVDDGGNDWIVDGVVVGDLIRIQSANTAGNEGVYRVASVTTTTSTNDTITLETEDTLAASDAADPIVLTPITGGSVFRVREDEGTGNNFIGWAMSAVEFMANDGSIWLYMRDGGSWAVGDYAEWTMEAGAFSLYDEWIITRTVTFDDTGGDDEITRSDYNGNFLRDGFVDGGLVEVSGSVSNDGTYLIDTVTAKTITLDTGETLTDEADVEVQLTPRQRVTVNFDDADAGFGNDPTIIRSSGSWVDAGYFPGGQIEISDAVDPGNNGTFLIASIDTDTVTDDTLVLDSAAVIADETSDVITATPRNHILLKWDEHRYRWSSNSGETGNSTQTLNNGEIPPIPDANDNYTSEWVGIGPGDDPVNSPQTIYCGWQSQFSGTTYHNVEIRGYDAVSDSSFGNMGNASLPSYIYLTRSPSMETYMTGDGAHVTGLMDVNTSVTEWFYAGFGNVHGSQNQHPRPLIIGGMGWQQTGSRNGNGDRYRFFPKGIDYTGSTEVNDPKAGSSCWARWVDGQWFSLANYHQSNGTQLFSPNEQNTEMHSWPYGNVGGISFPYDGGAQEFNGTAGSATTPSQSNGNTRNGMPAWLRATPTSITPGAENRIFPLLPVVGCLVKPDYNVVLDFRNILYTPGDSQATKNRIFQGDYTYIVGQNHEKTGQEDFAALRLA